MAKRKKLKVSDMIGTTNIADLLADDVLGKIGSTVCEDFRKDKESRKDWEKRSENAMKLALQVAEPKNFPWTSASNVKYPLLTLAAVQFAARVDLFQDNTFVHCQVNGFDPTGTKQDRCLRIQKHMDYQLVNEMPDWSEDNDRLFHALPIIGTLFKKTYFDSGKGTNCSELVFPTELVFDYWAKKVDDCGRKTHILFLTPNKIVEKQRRGLYRDVDLTGNQAPERDLAEKLEGQTVYEDDNAPREVLEQHRLWDLDDDGYQEPYIITVDRDTEQVLRIVARYDEDSIEKDGSEIISIVPDEYFTQFNFIPDPNGGNLGLGLGHLLGPVNESVNTLINQLIDAGTVSNLQSGFIGKGLRLKSGKLKFEPGEWKFVQSTGDELQKNIVPLPVRDPSPVLFNLLNLLITAGERVGSVTDAVTGENPPTNQPATSTLATIEQGLKVFKRVHRRLYDAFTKEFKKLFGLNRRYLDSEKYFSILDMPPNQMQQLAPITQQFMATQGQMLVTQDDYKANPDDVRPTADPNVITEMEKIKKVEVLMQTQGLFNWPIPEVKRRFVEAMNFPNADVLLQDGPPPPPPPEVMKLQMEQQKSQAQMQLDQARLQMEQERNQGEQQIKASEIQFKQQEFELEKQRLTAEIQKIEMDTVKVEADIRKVLAEIEQLGGNQDSVIELEKLDLERQKLAHESEIKRHELMLKDKEIDVSNAVKQYVNDSTNHKDIVLQMGKMMHEVHQGMQEQKGPKKISRDGSGLITGIGNMKVVRDDTGKAVGVEPLELPTHEAINEVETENGPAKKARTKKAPEKKTA